MVCGGCSLGFGCVSRIGLSANAQVELIGIIKLLWSDDLCMCGRAHTIIYVCASAKRLCVCMCVCAVLNKQLSISISRARGTPEAQVAQLDADTLDI